MRATNFTRLLLCITIMMASLPLFGQQDPLYSQYTFSLLAINPSYAGLRNQTDFSLNSRFQWAGVEGSPTTNILMGNTSIMNERGGLGLILSADRIGINRSTEGHIAYSYNFSWNDLTVSLGLQTGFVNFRYRIDELTLRVLDDPQFSGGEQTSTKVNFGTGFIVKGDKFMAGFSIPKALNNDFGNTEFNGIQYKRHYYLTGAYLFEAKSGLIIKPMMLLRAVGGAPLSVNFNTNVIINNRYWAGLYTNNLSTLGAMFQVEFSSAYKFGYSFEFFTGKDISSRLSSHEIYLSISFELLKGQSIFQHYF